MLIFNSKAVVERRGFRPKIFDDRLFGLNGNDTLTGGNGNDWLQGASGGAGTTAHIDRDVLLGGGGTDYYVLGTGNTSFYMSSGYATLRQFDIRYDWVVLANGIDYYSSRIQLQTVNISGGSAADTLISLDGNLIGVIEDRNFTTVDRGQLFLNSNQVTQGW